MSLGDKALETAAMAELLGAREWDMLQRLAEKTGKTPKEHIKFMIRDGYWRHLAEAWDLNPQILSTPIGRPRYAYVDRPDTELRKSDTDVERKGRPESPDLK